MVTHLVKDGWNVWKGGSRMAETKTAKAAGKGRSSEIVEGLLAKGKKNGNNIHHLVFHSL